MYKFICFLIEDAHGARHRRPQHFWSVLTHEAWHAWDMICCGSFLFGGLGVLSVLGSMQVFIIIIMIVVNVIVAVVVVVVFIFVILVLILVLVLVFVVILVVLVVLAVLLLRPRRLF